MRKRIDQILAERTPADEARLAEADTWTDEQIIRRALQDPDNPPLTQRQREQIRRGEPMTADPIGLMLLHLEYGEHSDEELAEVIGRVADLLRRRVAAHAQQRKAG